MQGKEKYFTQPPLSPQQHLPNFPPFHSGPFGCSGEIDTTVGDVRMSDLLPSLPCDNARCPELSHGAWKGVHSPV